MARPLRVSSSSIGAEIRKKQRELRSLKRGASAAVQERIDLRIRQLEQTYNQLKSTCKGWNLL